MPGAPLPSRVHLRADALATGGWLGLTQVALGFRLMAGTGAAAALFFALTCAWLAGGCAGVWLGRPRALRTLLAAALGLCAASRLGFHLAPFHPAMVALGLVAGAVSGAYAGAFLRQRATVWGEVQPLLLHENNGFIAGYVGAVALLFVSSDALEIFAAALGVGLLLARPPQGRPERERARA